MLVLLTAAAGMGCRRNPFPANTVSPPDLASPLSAQGAAAPAQVTELGRRAQSLDRNNQELHRELAESSQETQLLREQVKALQDRLDGVSAQLQDSLAARQKAESQVQAMQASTTPRGATLKPNNSVRSSLRSIDIPGVKVSQEDDVIRIELPADELFQRGSVQWTPTAASLLDRVAAAIRGNYPKQIVGIEGHTDASVLGIPGGAQQLSASQALAVYQHFTTRGGVPAKQLFTLGYGSNRPRVSNATDVGQQRNRRIELVVYPEEFK